MSKIINGSVIYLGAFVQIDIIIKIGKVNGAINPIAQADIIKKVLTP